MLTKKEIAKAKRLAKRHGEVKAASMMDISLGLLFSVVAQ